MLRFRHVTLLYLIGLCITQLLVGCAPIQASVGSNQPLAQSGAAAVPPATDQARIFFIEPTDGATVTNPILIAMGAENFTIQDAGTLDEGTGHFALTIDADCVPPQTVISEDANHLLFPLGQAEIMARLPIGEHQLCLQAVDGMNKTLEGSQMSQVITIAVEQAADSDLDLANKWMVYQADSGYAIRYPLKSYSIRPGITTAPEVFYPGVQVLVPNDSFIYGEPRANTYQLSIAVSANSRPLSLDQPEQLLASGQLMAFDPALLDGKTIQSITLGGEPALRVDDLPIGPAGITTLIMAIHHDRIYELLVEPYALFTNQADRTQTDQASAENAALIEQIIATFKFAGA